MKFWDTSALIPLLVGEPWTPQVRMLFAADPNIVVSFITPLEMTSALTRRARANPRLDRKTIDAQLARLEFGWTLIDEYERLLSAGRRMALLYNLRSGDALQLASALLVAAGRPAEVPFVCVDRDLIAAASSEGFPTLP